jgi:hypothetical protein
MATTRNINNAICFTLAKVTKTSMVVSRVLMMIAVSPKNYANINEPLSIGSKVVFS